jgi:hypothetical protein
MGIPDILNNKKRGYMGAYSPHVINKVSYEEESFITQCHSTPIGVKRILGYMKGGPT